MTKKEKLIDILKITGSVIGLGMTIGCGLGAVAGVNTYIGLNNLKNENYKDAREIARDYINYNTYNPIKVSSRIAAEYFLDDYNKELKKENMKPNVDIKYDEFACKD